MQLGMERMRTLGEGGRRSRQRTREADDRSGSCRRLVGMMARRVVGSGCHAACTFFAFARGMSARIAEGRVNAVRAGLPRRAAAIVTLPPQMRRDNVPVSADVVMMEEANLQGDVSDGASERWHCDWPRGGWQKWWGAGNSFSSLLSQRREGALIIPPQRPINKIRAALFLTGLACSCSSTQHQHRNAACRHRTARTRLT